MAPLFHHPSPPQRSLAYRHITLSLLAHVVLAVLRIQEKKTPAGLIALSVAELRKLLSKLMEKAGETVE
ncbi:hypothetical protein ID853_04440 [Xenorhabdus sp. Vera]|uniref:hypothetical protein n=1 Tax=Xenorhabdus koppenhoeferi TaxID=351659 RepID=UPI0019A89818|nr:hypothetical protein [Xenorhabdus sp. Vera]MBD2810149.1 hypothetical protein [Xenorhabdus sp. Vera]